MSNRASTAEPGASAPGDAAMTDEQLWDEIAREERQASGGAARSPSDRDDPPPDDDRPQVSHSDRPDASGYDEDEDQDAGPELAALEDEDEDQTPSEAKEDRGKGSGKGAAKGSDESAETLDQQIERLQHKFSSSQGRLASKDREIAELQRQLATAEARLARGENDDDASRRDQLRQKIAEAKEEYGDAIGPISEQMEDLERRLDQLTEQEKTELAAKRDQYDALVAEQQQIFLKEHRDGFNVLVQHRQAFDQWIDDQPRRIRDIYAANKDAIVDGEDAALLVSLFKKDVLSTAAENDAPAPDRRLPPKRQRQIDGARATQTQGQKAATGRPPRDGASEEDYWDYWARREQRDQLTR